MAFILLQSDIEHHKSTLNDGEKAYLQYTEDMIQKQTTWLKGSHTSWEH